MTISFFRQPENISKSLYTQALRLVWWVRKPTLQQNLRFCGGSKTHPTLFQPCQNAIGSFQSGLDIFVIVGGGYKTCFKWGRSK
ncbi:MAG: hypothetical protein IKX14_05680, partial [Neisseriaceae bacterium]|nr:hypothetical protein [Neisseriaceae bacterium]